MTSQNKYWDHSGGVVIGVIHPLDAIELRAILHALHPNKVGTYYFVEDPFIWKGMDYIVTIDEESDQVARLVFDCPVYYAPQVLGHPLRTGGEPVIQKDGTVTMLTPVL